ncbi:L-threonylcarbamoyladenylate synthase [Spirochaetota bacterium]
MIILSTSDQDLDRAAQAIQKGLLVVIPTETVYGLGANLWNRHALARVFEAKKRPSFDPLIVHIAKIGDMAEIADTSVPHALRLAERFWPGPLTMVLPKKEKVPELATSGLPTVAVRCPAHPVAMEIIRRSGVPVAAPSANPFGYLSPTRAEHVIAQLGDKVDFIVDGGRCKLGVESTVLDLSVNPPVVLRPGGLPVELLAELIPDIQVFGRSASSPKAPGQLPSHYAPRKALYLIPQGLVSEAGPRPATNSAILCFGQESCHKAKQTGLWAKVLDMSPGMDSVEAASVLFEYMHELDSRDYTEIWAELLPENGLGRAVNDRLYKASFKG